MQTHTNSSIPALTGSSMGSTDSAEAEIQHLLEQALISSIDELNTQHTADDIYALAVYCASGCASMGLAFNTVAWLEEKANEQSHNETRAYYELHASQWKEVNYGYAHFFTLNERLDEIFEDLYEADLSDDEISELFVRVLTRTINSTDMKNRIKTSFKGDLLLGMQFGDPSQRDWNAALEVSRHVNCPEWHTKLEALQSS